jgi:hypothetical protein
MDFEPECTFHEALDCRLGNPKPDATEDNAAVAAWKRPFAGRRAGIRL